MLWLLSDYKVPGSMLTISMLKSILHIKFFDSFFQYALSALALHSLRAGFLFLHVSTVAERIFRFKIINCSIISIGLSTPTYYVIESRDCLYTSMKESKGTLDFPLCFSQNSFFFVFF